MQVSTVTRRSFKSPTESERAKGKELMEKQRKLDDRLVKGMFEFVDAGAGWFEFNCRIYPGEVYKYYLTHGEITEIPYGIVKLLNNTYRKVRTFDPSKSADQHPGKGVPFYTKTARVRFIPTDVM